MASPAVAPAVSPATAADLFDLLHKSGLFKPEYLSEKLAEFEFPADAVGAASTLIRAGLLTQFQAKLLLAGKYRGFRLGTYLIRDQLGKGGMGTVYLAEHATLRRKVALKLLAADPNQRAAVERFLREARATAALDHPNIVRVFDVMQTGELHYIVMEYVEGKTLDALVQGGGAMAPGRAVTYISQAAAGLQHAYEKGFVHRDIKPANLMVSKDGTVKVLDMGLARSLVDEGDRVTEVLDEGAVVGTADYISPEQATNQPGIDIRADIYSLGATLFALITGQPPFTGSTSQVLMQHQLKTAPSLADYDRTIAPGLAAVVAKMLAKKPADRFGTPAEVIAALAPWLPNRDGAQKVMAGLSSSELGRGSGALQNTIEQVLNSSTRSLPRPDMDVGKPKTVWIAVGSAVAAFGLAIGGYLLLSSGKLDESKQVVAAVRPDAGVTAPKGTTSTTTARPVSTTTSPTTRRPAAARAGVGRVLYALDLADQKPFSVRGLSERLDNLAEDIRLVPDARTGDGEMPAGWRGSSWAEKADAEFFTALTAGRMALGMRNHVNTSAMLFAPRMTFTGPTAKVRFTYRTDGVSTGHVFKFKPTEPVALAWEILSNNRPDQLPDTNGAWKTRELEVDLKGATAGYFEFHNTDGDPGRAFYLNEFEVIDPHAAAVGPRSVLFQFDANAVASDFQIKLGQNQSEGELPAGLPEDHHAGCWSSGATGVLVRTTVDGQPAIGLASRSGDASAQLVFGLKSNEFEPGKEYQLRVVHQTKGDVGGVVLVQHIESNYASLGEVRMTPSTAGWQTSVVPFKRPAGGTIKIAFQSSRVADKADDLAYIRSVELIDSTSAQPVSAAEFSALTDDRVTLNGQGKQSPTLGGTLPKGWQINHWDKDTSSEFRSALIDGTRAVGVRMTRGNKIGAQLKASDTAFGPEMAVGDEVVIRLVYRADGPGRGEAAVQLDVNPYTRQTKVPLPPTGGEWKEVEMTYRRPTSSPFALVIESPTPAGEADNTVWVKSVTWWPVNGAPASTDVTTRAPSRPTSQPAAPPPAASGASLGRKVGGITLTGLPVFRGRFADGKAVGDFPASRPGLSWYCWKKESAAEFRGENTDKGPALGVTNLNDDVSSQLNMALEELAGEQGLRGGVKYVLRVEYKTSNDAAGTVQVRTPDYKTVTQAELANTSDGWKWAELTFTRAEGQKLHAILESTTVGEGNTFWLRAAELHEAR